MKASCRVDEADGPCPYTAVGQTPRPGRELTRVISAIRCGSGKDNGIKCNGVGGPGEPLGEGDLRGETRYTVGAKGTAAGRLWGETLKKNARRIFTC